MNIAICDDDYQLCMYLKKLIINKYNNFVSVHIFNSTQDMIKNIENKQLPNAILMDICVGNDNGINSLKEISKLVKNIPVIFITGYTEYCQDIFIGFTPWGLLTKPIDEEKLFYHLNKVIECYKSSNLIVNINAFGKKFKIKASDIIYVESRERKVIYHLYNLDYTEYIKLDNAIQKLSTDFLRIHKSYAINLNYVKDFNKSEITLTTNTVVPISRHNIENVKKAIFEYTSKQIGI